jgi:hypothetical protein
MLETALSYTDTESNDMYTHQVSHLQNNGLST